MARANVVAPSSSNASFSIEMWRNALWPMSKDDSAWAPSMSQTWQLRNTRLSMDRFLFLSSSSTKKRRSLPLIANTSSNEISMSEPLLDNPHASASQLLSFSKSIRLKDRLLILSFDLRASIHASSRSSPPISKLLICAEFSLRTYSRRGSRTLSSMPSCHR